MCTVIVNFIVSALDYNKARITKSKPSNIGYRNFPTSCWTSVDEFGTTFKWFH
jgi:hypothetical protein